MRKLLLLVGMLFSLAAQASLSAEPIQPSDLPAVPAWVVSPPSVDGPDSFDMHAMPLSQVISLYFKEVSKQPYVLCDAVLGDNRSVSIRAVGRNLDAAIFRAVLDSNGYEVRNVSGVATVCTKPPEQQADPKATKGTPFVYRPLHQDVGYLVDILSPLVEGHFANRRTAGRSLKVGGGGEGSDLTTAAQSAQGDELLVFSGEKPAIDRLQALLVQLDVPSPSVVVRAVLYEVAHTKTDGSALKMMANLFDGHVGISFGTDSFSNTLSIKGPDFDFVASAISEDGRFKVVTSPFARVRNNQRVRLQVGADVPVNGQILINPNGQTTQSTEYRSSGVILDVTARIRGRTVDVDLVQTVSNFVKTTTGNTNPTLNKREITSSLTVADGELIVLGGLTDTKEEKAKRGLFGWNFSDSDSDTKSELVLLLQVERL
ncbi:type II secretion system protein GspD [Stutzerimonas nitrititolerans]|uniref:type II secretion system protein GspD n=1 Tax=Stutzerimonas nitrititolerans TaxID=2482751 RepID=UPI00289D5140|nr:hypothetical protein [Stutzerimonas nitrititolerans]